MRESALFSLVLPLLAILAAGFVLNAYRERRPRRQHGRGSGSDGGDGGGHVDVSASETGDCSDGAGSDGGCGDGGGGDGGGGD